MTNSNMLVIHKLPILFSILNEIKSILKFDLISINDNKIEEYFNEKNSLIISSDQKLKTKNLITLKAYPINIYKLIEVVNIQFLKNRFNQQNNINVGKYNINLNSRKMICKNKSLSLTEKETKIINYLNNSINPVTINNLQSEVWGHKSKLETHTVETHVYRLIKKVEKKFNDKSFILSLKNGYKIES